MLSIPPPIIATIAIKASDTANKWRVFIRRVKDELRIIIRSMRGILTLASLAQDDGGRTESTRYNLFDLFIRIITCSMSGIPRLSLFALLLRANSDRL